ncbi:N-acetylmannosamine-6-phosphate 2-epimerase [Bacteroides stercorirosoris]|uniref:Putative N-acetylmannosamine-6-phosphate 2-epimerase n=1 Tax=Bacteroides stercorirosoris TaxID=871324 RepID=A0A413H403_9BACE|nr:N-acetylmannosamine-6-phosphate 2-epimerase [Bacteroides stercorirosoris]OKZ11670.1 MAG: N-acetylmannosamine-6-phosphate 2-epimerase [Bacteroides oleiciplenus]RGX78275.1 putative N-acetylmannosamine-6-phosphate 2-epimerase [Bacteroides stercorirosoris]
MNDILEKLQYGMIVSCQSEEDDPFNADPMYMGLFAKAAEMGGAVGIRTQGIEKLKAIKQAVHLPVIGLLKSQFPDGTVRITGSFKEVEELIVAGSDIVAIDGTFRVRENLDGPSFIKAVKEKYGCLVLADIATFEEAKACEENGADAISTTLSGYTPDTLSSVEGPNFYLLERILKDIKIPVFAEGRFNVPAEAQKAMEMGSYGVITGTAITRPRVTTKWFVEAVNKGKQLKK